MGRFPRPLITDLFSSLIRHYTRRWAKIVDPQARQWRQVLARLIGSWPKAAKHELMSCGRLCSRGTCVGNGIGVSGGQGLAFGLFAEGQEQDSDYEGETGEGYGGAERLEVANSCAD